MKLTIERKIKKDGYTVGELWIDGKRICDTLEATDRGLRNDAKVGLLTSDEWQKAEREAKRTVENTKKYTTAIPTGYYRVVKRMSGVYSEWRLFLRNVPGFQLVMIRNGRKASDCKDGILVGKFAESGNFNMSAYWLKVVNDMVFEALDRKEDVILRISPPSRGLP